MLDILFDAICWFLVAFSLGSIPVLVGFVIYDHYRLKRVHQQPVMGPFRPNVRRVM